MTGFIDELIDESFGTSSKRWAVILFAMSVGALGALWYVGRDGGRAPATGSLPAAPDPVTTDSPAARAGGAATRVASTWRKVSTPPAVMRRVLGAPPMDKGE